MESVNSFTATRALGDNAAHELRITLSPEAPRLSFTAHVVQAPLPQEQIGANQEEFASSEAPPAVEPAAEEAVALEPELPTEPAIQAESDNEPTGESGLTLKPEMTELERARTLRALTVEDIFKKKDHEDQLKGTQLQKQVGRDFGLVGEERRTVFNTLVQMGILTIVKHPTGQEADILTIYPEAVRKAIDLGYLPSSIEPVLGDQPSPEQTPMTQTVEASQPYTLPQAPSPETRQSKPTPSGSSAKPAPYVMSGKQRRALAATENQPPHVPSVPQEPKAATPSPQRAAEDFDPHQGLPIAGSAARQQRSSRRPSFILELAREDTEGRYAKSSSISEAATDHSLTPPEVSLLSHEGFLALALTTPALQRKFTTGGEFGQTVIATTGLKDKALGRLIAFFVKQSYVEERDDSRGYKLTPEGKAFLVEEIAKARR